MPNRNLGYFQKIFRPIPPDKKSKVGKQEDFITKETSSNFEFKALPNLSEFFDPFMQPFQLGIQIWHFSEKNQS